MTDTSSETAMSGGEIGLEEIKRLLPHRYPFLMVDRVLHWQLEPEKTLRAIKNVTINEPFFPGHFPGHPVMPGVMIIEALAQAAGVLSALSQSVSDREGSLYYLVKIDKARFNKTVVPGDQLLLDVREVRRKRGMGLFEGIATVADRKVASAELLCAGKN